MLAYLCVVNNPSDDLRLRAHHQQARPAASAPRTIDMAPAPWRPSEGCSLYEVISHARAYPGADSRQRRSSDQFADAHPDGLQRLASRQWSCRSFTTKLLQRHRLSPHAARRRTTVESRTRIENVQELTLLHP